MSLLFEKNIEIKGNKFFIACIYMEHEWFWCVFLPNPLDNFGIWKDIGIKATSFSWHILFSFSIFYTYRFPDCWCQSWRQKPDLCYTATAAAALSSQNVVHWCHFPSGESAVLPASCDTRIPREWCIHQTSPAGVRAHVEQEEGCIPGSLPRSEVSTSRTSCSWRDHDWFWGSIMESSS